jgi:hypothetical protein
MRVRIYMDTSVLGGCEDDEFRAPSRRLLQAFQRGELTLVLSEPTIRELEGSPDAVRAALGTVPGVHIEALALSSRGPDANARRASPPAPATDGTPAERCCTPPPGLPGRRAGARSAGIGLPSRDPNRKCAIRPDSAPHWA